MDDTTYELLRDIVMEKGVVDIINDYNGHPESLFECETCGSVDILNEDNGEVIDVGIVMCMSCYNKNIETTNGYGFINVNDDLYIEISGFWRDIQDYNFCRLCEEYTHSSYCFKCDGCSNEYCNGHSKFILRNNGVKSFYCITCLYTKLKQANEGHFYFHINDDDIPVGDINPASINQIFAYGEYNVEEEINYGMFSGF